ncbi:RNA polymerase sigma factor [Pseudonocardia sp. KRD291]|uniref:RNA polymerase sigma factor n=1 Tax=Pseudonocardia sp. KRD291 TaxID=2792007 RepID=UPI001C4A2FDE|nr:RNA polymerase sigma factor [Pseudonocardia sp. KRD291]MBW0102928.1 RNA polymerase sigma factor [Pseudonocardia sp. KRD291]
MPDRGNAHAPAQSVDPSHETPPVPQARPPAPSHGATRTSGTVGTRAARSARARGEQIPAEDSLIPDDELLQAHLDGDPQTFNELVRRHRTLLRIVALRVLENHHDADDAVQDGLIKAFRGAHTYAGRSSVGAWLRTIIENTARTAARNRQRDRGRSTQLSESRDLADTEAIGADPADVVADRAAVADALAQIPEQWRHTFELVKVNGLTYAEAAEVLGVPTGTIRSRINRANAARARHRALCREDGNHPGASPSLLN